jgi:predicted transcriptional regulator
MSEPSKLSRRERQIMDILYTREGATVAEVRDKLPNPPTDKAVRRMLQILEEKGVVSRRKGEREFVYRPRQTKRRAGVNALRHVLDTFFEGSVDQAVAAHFSTRESGVTEEQLERLRSLVEEAREEGR